jgi:hypothetical protein
MDEKNAVGLFRSIYVSAVKAANMTRVIASLRYGVLYSFIQTAINDEYELSAHKMLLNYTHLRVPIACHTRLMFTLAYAFLPANYFSSYSEY